MTCPLPVLAVNKVQQSGEGIVDLDPRWVLDHQLVYGRLLAFNVLHARNGRSTISPSFASGRYETQLDRRTVRETERVLPKVH